MKRILAVMLAVALAGCAVSRSPDEAGCRATLAVAQERLASDDERARERIAALEQEWKAAYYAWRAASQAASAPEGERPTSEQIDALGAKVNAAADAYLARIESLGAQYDDFLLRYPRNWQVRERYAWFLQDVNRIDQAADEYGRVIALNPGHADAYHELGWLWMDNGRPEEAMDRFHQAIAVEPAEPEFHLSLGTAYFLFRYPAQRKYGWDLPRVWRELIAEYRRARELVPQSKRIARELATTYVSARHFGVGELPDEALDAWQYYLSLPLTPQETAAASRNVGIIHWKQKKDPHAARPWLEKAAALGDQAARSVLKEMESPGT